MIVADTNLLVYLLIDGPLPSRFVPTIEFGPSLRCCVTNYCTCFRDTLNAAKLARDEAIRHYKRAMSMVDVSGWHPDPMTILNMAERSKCSTYDLEYVWLAQELNVPLVTADNDVLKAYPDVAVGIKPYTTGSRP